jgi:two-component system, cell cycle sensor histidine kinase and response regulator CckA
MSAAAEFSWRPHDDETQLRLLFAKATVGLAEVHRPGYVTPLNPVLEYMLGASPGLARSVQFADLIPVENRAESESCLRELFNGERDSFRVEAKLASAHDRRLRWTAWRVAGSGGKPDYALAMVEDATDPRADQRLQHADRLEAVGRLAGGVAHDFNNLLTGVLLYCDLLLTSLEPGHRVGKYVEEIRSATTQASGLVRQLLAVARPHSYGPRVLSLNGVVEGMRNLLARLIGENIELRFLLDPALGLVKMDPTQAQQVLLNLVLNARDAMPGGGQITVETSNCRVQVLARSGPGVVPASLPCAMFVVGDNGRGMDEETRAHLFEAFFTTKSAAKGTGLGLATVHDIVTSNGGLIHVDSAPNCGARVTLILPLVPAGAMADSESASSQNVASDNVSSHNVTSHNIKDYQHFPAKKNEGVLPLTEED